MLLLSIDLTWNNLFWAIFGGLIGLLLSHYWTKYQNREKLVVKFYCSREYHSKCFFLYAIITNNGNKALPNLSIKIKGVYPYYRNMNFTQVYDNLTELKPFQYQRFRIQISDSNNKLIEAWEMLLNKKIYDTSLYVKINADSGHKPKIYSNTYAVRALAQVLYYYENNFTDSTEGWGWIEKKEREKYIKKILNKFNLKPSFPLKYLFWDKNPRHSKI